MSASALDHPLLPVLVHESRLSADEGLIDFDFTSELLKEISILHGKPDALLHEPRGLLGDAESAVNLVAADAVLAIGFHPNADQPLVQRQRRVLHDRARLDAEARLRMSDAAFPNATGLYEADAVRSATRAADFSIRP